MLTVDEEPVESRPAQGLGHVWVAEADEGADDGLALLNLLLEWVLHPLTSPMKEAEAI